MGFVTMKNKKGDQNNKWKTLAGSVGILGVGMASGFVGSELVDNKKDLSQIVEMRNDCGVIAAVKRVVDGDTILMVNGDRVRLIGVDAPDRGECYYDETLVAVKELVEGKEIRLEKDVSGTDRYGRLLRYVMIPSGNKYEDDLNLSNVLVEQGLVEAVNSAPDLRYRRTMISLQQEAVREDVGIWKNCPDKKEKASSQWQVNVEPASEDCVIKGNISQHGAGMVYMIPGCDNYNTTKIDPSRGEKYFCTETEAEKAGFRKAQNCP